MKLSTVCLFLHSIYLVIVNAGGISVDMLDATYNWHSVPLLLIDNTRINTKLRLNELISSNHSLPVSLFHEVQSDLPLDTLKSFLDYHNQCNNFHPFMLLKVSIRMDIDNTTVQSLSSLLRDLEFIRDDMMLRISFNINSIEFFDIKLKVTNMNTFHTEHIVQCNTHIDDTVLTLSMHIKSWNNSRTSIMINHLLGDEYNHTSGGISVEDLDRMNKSLYSPIDSLLHLSELQVSYVPQPEKVDLSVFNAKSSPLSNNEDYVPTVTVSSSTVTNDYGTISNNCSLLGVSHAIILNKVIINSSYTLHSDSSMHDNSHPSTGIRLLCGIYTTEQNHMTRVKAQRLTWGQRCSHFLVFSTATDLSIPSINIPHIGEESYENLWQKVRFIWKYIHYHYLFDFDWFLLSGDDTYVVVENLVEYLSSAEVVAEKRKNAGVYLGRMLVNPFLSPPLAFNSGGAGYILDDNALRVLHHNAEMSHCRPHGPANEDTMLARCLRDSLNRIIPHNTSDGINEQRFHIFTPGFHYLYKRQQSDSVLRSSVNDDWYGYYDEHIREGSSCCSSKSISFHYISVDLMHEIHNYLYSCPLEMKMAYYSSKADTFGFYEFHDPMLLRYNF